MNRILYEIRCKCKEEISITKKRKSSNRSEGKPFSYPSLNEITFKTFQIKYEKKLSSVAKLLLNNFQNKYLYYAIDDILYLLNSNKIERDNLLAILYSSMLSLHNDFSINFFDIWIDSVYLNDSCETNRFLENKSQDSNQNNITHITLKLHYFTRTPIKKPEPIW